MKSVKVWLKTKIQDDPYGFNLVKFAYCTKPSKSNRVTQLGGIVSCREDMGETLRKRHNTKSYKSLDLSRTRLLTILRKPFNTPAAKLEQRRKTADVQMQASLKLINHYERKHGWALTRLYIGDPGELIPSLKTGTPKDAAPYIFVYVVVGSNKWMKSTHYMSLYLLLIRLGRSEFTSKFKNQSQLNKELESYIQRHVGDASHLSAVYKYIDIVMANQEELLEKRTDMFKLSALSDKNLGYHEGIRKLCRAQTNDLRLRHKFLDILKRYEI
jgi:hypothetical protein